MKKLIIFISLLAILLWAVSCGTAEGEDEKYYVFYDDAGQQVSLYGKPKRVAVLFSSYAEMWLLAGGEISVSVGESVERGFASDDIILVDGGAGKVIDFEALVAAEPDFVIGSADIEKQREACDFMAKSGIASALFTVESFDDYARVMEHFCAITENSKAYEEHVIRVGAEIDTLLEKYSGREAKSILFVRAATSAKSTKAKTAENNFVCAMLSELGTRNIADSAPLLLDGLSLEAIISADPDFIFFSTMGDENRVREYMDGELAGEVWQTLDAVKLGNYAYLPKDMFQYKPNHRWGEAYKYLAELLYE